MPSPVVVRVGCDTKFYDLVHGYARERGQNVSEVMREALVERMARDRAKLTTKPKGETTWKRPPERT